MWISFWASLSVPAPDQSTCSAATPEATLPHQDNQDTPLIERIRNGDNSAFDEIVERHQNRIYNLCCWMLNDREEAADAAQDAFVRAFRGLKNFRGDCALSTWLHRIAVNVCRDAAARRHRAPLPAASLFSTDEDDAPDFDPADTSTTPDESVLQHARRRAVRVALAELPENHRAVLVLFDIQGHSYEEAAAALEVPVGTVKSRLNRARLALRDLLEPQKELFEA